MKTVEILEKELNKLGYKTKTVISSTNFGNSHYLYVTTNNEEYITEDNSLKIRFSDHSVTNFERIFKEVHFFINVEYSEELLESVLFETRLCLETSRYFSKKDDFIEEIDKFETPKPRDTDEIISERLNKNGNKTIYTVVRRKKIDAIRYTYTENGKYILIKKNR